MSMDDLADTLTQLAVAQLLIGDIQGALRTVEAAEDLVDAQRELEAAKAMREGADS